MTRQTIPLGPDGRPLYVTGRRIAGFVAMVVGMFMAILDIQIVAASLGEIQAGLSASAEEISWVQTSYLVAEVVMIPLSGFLSRVASTRYVFVVSAAGFTFTSLLCGTATNIEEMIVFRALQGFIGGAMIPSVFTAAYSIFPRDKQGLVSAIIGLIATLAPTIGPTTGGYLTDLLSWHWLFFVNVVPGIGVTIAALFLIDFDEPHWALFDHFDYVGLVAMAGFLGSLEYVLEEGPGKDWFQDDRIVVGAIVSTISGLVFFYSVFTREEPIVDLRTYRNSNFAAGSALAFVLGIALYGLVYLYPLYLARVRGYSSLQIGELMIVTGICQMLSAPFVGALTQRFDPRRMVMLGFAGLAYSTWQLTDITKDWGFWELFLPQVIRGVSLMFTIIPINIIALGTLPQQQLKNATGLFNLMRNLGGAFGLAGINTVLNTRWDLHLARLHDGLRWGRGIAEDLLASLTLRAQEFGLNADPAALKRLALLVRREALVMAFADVFVVMAALLMTMAVLTLFVRRPGPPAGSKPA